MRERQPNDSAARGEHTLDDIHTMERMAAEAKSAGERVRARARARGEEPGGSLVETMDRWRWCARSYKRARTVVTNRQLVAAGDR